MNLRNLLPACLAIASGSDRAGEIQAIVEVQMPMMGTDASPFVGLDVTVEGVVTSSGEPDNLGAVHIQQPGEDQWAGIELRGLGLSDLVVGDTVRVFGEVEERSTKTTISVNTIEVIGSGSIAPLKLDPNQFTNFSLVDTEPYESMLVELIAPADVITVGERNADGPNNNFAEWRVGSDPMSPMEGCRIVTGRVTSSVVSSLNVSWVNDLVWESNSGRMNVPPIVVQDGDKFESIVGIMDYSFSNMKLLPRNNADVAPIIFDDGFENPSDDS